MVRSASLMVSSSPHPPAVANSSIIPPTWSGAQSSTALAAWFASRSFPLRKRTRARSNCAVAISICSPRTTSLQRELRPTRPRPWHGHGVLEMELQAHPDLLPHPVDADAARAAGEHRRLEIEGDCVVD